jgi:hypothetical protein
LKWKRITFIKFFCILPHLIIYTKSIM